MINKTHILILLLIHSFCGLSQSIVPQYDTSSILNEKILLFTNKQTYLAGEELEFDFVTYDAVYNSIVDISSVAYVELIDQGGLVVMQSKAKISNGRGKGKFTISNKLSTDYYILRIYTQYMRNFGINNFTHERISIINTFKYLSSKDISLENDFSFNIRVKNNILNANVVNKIGVKMKNIMPELFTLCKIIDESGVEQVSSTLYNDVLILEFIPEVSKNYYVELNYNNETRKVKLPKVRLNPTIKIEEAESKFNIVCENCDSFGLNYTLLKNNIKLNSFPIHEKSLSISKESIQSGIYCVVITNNNEVIDYSYFYKKYPHEKIRNSENQIHVKTKEVKNLGENIENTICYIIPENTFENKNTLNPLLSNDLFNVSDTLEFGLNDSIMSNQLFVQYLLLGLVKPNFQIEKFNFLAESDGDMISGVLQYSENLSPASNVNILVTIPDSLHYFLDVSKTDEAGEFNFLIAENYISPYLVFSSYDSTENYSLHLKKEFEKSVIPVAKDIFVPDKRMADYLRKQMLALQVQDAFISSTDSLKPVIKTNFYGSPDKTVFFDDFIKLPIFQEYVKELMTGVYVIKKKKKKYLRISNFDAQGFTGENPLIIVNGVHVRNHQILMNLNPKDVAYVRIVNHIIYFKDIRFDGVFEVVLKKNIEYNKLNNKNLFVEDYICPYKPLSKLYRVTKPNIPIYSNSMQINTDNTGLRSFTTTNQKDVYQKKEISIDKNLNIGISLEEIIVE